jgi:pimeloyl-ACP methyl ester carboxylesterase
VITYERRGCGRSIILDPGRRPTVLDHARDAAEIVRAAGFQRADIFGSSAGATVGLCLITIFPEVVQTLVAHEAPLVQMLSDAPALRSAFRSIQSIEQQEGAIAAAAAFFSATGILGEAPLDVLMAIATTTASRVPPPYHEVEEIISFQPDIDALITQRRQIIIATASVVTTSMPRRASEEIARRLGVSTLVFPGNHFGYLRNGQNHPDKFAVSLRSQLESFAARCDAQFLVR